MVPPSKYQIVFKRCFFRSWQRLYVEFIEILNLWYAFCALKPYNQICELNIDKINPTNDARHLIYSIEIENAT